jgi:acyl-CoA synthetase (NDP forming)
VADAVLRELGALRIGSTQQALDYAETATKRIYPVNTTLGVLTVSGGAGILIADDAERLGLPMPEMPQTAQAEMLALLGLPPRNPVDCTAQALNQLDLVVNRPADGP